MADPQNANPTILNASDLPTRRRRPSSTAHKSTNTFTTTSSTFSQGIFSLSPTSTGYLSDSSSSFVDTTFSSDGSDISSSSDDDATGLEPIDAQEIYDLISTISDPEHPLSLGSLAVVNLPDISIAPTLPPDRTRGGSGSDLQTVTVLITPTITHCSLATVIGLGVRVRLEQSLPPRFRVDVRIKEGTHSTADEVNKQLADKERVAAALENSTLMGVIKKMLETCV